MDVCEESNKWVRKLTLFHRSCLDFTVKYTLFRWIYFAALFFTFWFVVIARSSHYVVAYMYAVFLLNLVLRFITPLSFDDLCAAHEDANKGTILPLNEQEALNSSKIKKCGLNYKENVYEFKPFLRQMNEFTFWLSAVRVTYIACFSLFFDFLDVDVFWPLLVLYFVLLFLTTMNQQIKNMIKYKYVPFNFCKCSFFIFLQLNGRIVMEKLSNELKLPLSLSYTICSFSTLIYYYIHCMLHYCIYYCIHYLIYTLLLIVCNIYKSCGNYEL
ncbi:rer1 family protein, putative [Theileria annulata]|uniref:Rer1 family protein, putative n=1 Tax=Theileria annulata TaxID=5874 RepID=Q4UBB4_THEAN|nr:rer1 family protein, putative [Theileria annulata]CAI75887.1 rer1 family protein, putative [Theileria annulata]|eukprot:XP_955363.1 rer1 family protein, putative [Theileria annulata]